MHELALFAGAGGGILGGKLLGWRTVCAVEIDDYARRVLMARQDDGCLDPFPIWDDVTTFDGHPWRGVVDIVTGGFPCQDISACNAKAEGIDGERSGLWSAMARIIREVGPRYVLVENSPILTSRGLGRVVGDLAGMGYDAQWGVLGALHAGAPHRRERIWIVGAKPDAQGWARILPCDVRRSEGPRGWWPDHPLDTPGAAIAWLGNRHGEPALLGDPHGVAHIVDRLHCCGNGQVPAVVRLAWSLLSTFENQGGRVGLPNHSLGGTAHNETP